MWTWVVVIMVTPGPRAFVMRIQLASRQHQALGDSATPALLRFFWSRVDPDGSCAGAWTDSALAPGYEFETRLSLNYSYPRSLTSTLTPKRTRMSMTAVTSSKVDGRENDNMRQMPLRVYTSAVLDHSFKGYMVKYGIPSGLPVLSLLTALV
ncbi:hypothetical protein B0F90DRAFT_1120934 [Multifurca ochricompacta]|uniref:Uncharacterized protein n=1 Tax=Multifurca ochricompacta TaxID=376703 RepID=A0AAD4LZV6_9AGAM|nr:hypothetical protein B0F90DRAFT_1120934 [Multifurca ochricompacta]